MDTPPILSLRHVCKERLHGTAGFALHIPHLDVPHGARVALVGPSGCGKSTALDILSAVLRPDMGEDFYFAPEQDRQGQQALNIDILALWREGKLDTLAALRRKHVGYVLQTGGLLPFLTARANILLGCQGMSGTTSGIAHMTHMARRLGIDRLLNALPKHLSVGERQRVAIARALAHKPCLVLADEPTAALDPINADIVMELFTELTSELGSTVIMVTHAPHYAEKYGFRLVRTHVQREGDAVLSRLGTLP